jgi:hypothetical protein
MIPLKKIHKHTIERPVDVNPKCDTDSSVSFNVSDLFKPIEKSHLKWQKYFLS